jgi:hypothetical protein
MGRILFLSAVAYLAYRYIGRSNKKHEEIAAKLGKTEVLAPASKPSAAVTPAAQTPKLLKPASSAVEPDPQR